MFKKLNLLILCFLVSIIVNQEGFSQAVPSGFTTIDINTNLDNDAIGFALLPDERILVVNQFSGTVDLIVNGNLKSAPLLTVPDLEAVLEKGLLGIAVDPDFPSAPHIYLFHSHTGGSNRVSRFTVDGELMDPNSENLSIQVSSQLTLVSDMLAQNSWHNGGTLRFGNDKTLYISHGDDGQRNLVQDLTTLNGKILRINRDGSIPANNPTFPNAPTGTRPEIFSFGLRNPFRFTIDSQTDDLLIGDVGKDTWEELNLSVGGENYGWPRYEGNDEFDPNATLIQPDPVFPFWVIQNISGQQFSVIPIAVYRQQAFPNDFSFPNEYEGGYFYADFFHDWIRYVTSDGTGGWASMDFGSSFSNIVDGAPGADGSLYVLEFGNKLVKIIYDNPVPVELSFFNAALQNGTVIITWITETESTNYGFEIQKSRNGEFFRKIGFVPGQGSSTQRRSYTFEDPEIETGKYYYRLKQIDTNGSFEFSQVVIVEIGGPDEPALAQNYPNPFNPTTQIRYSLSSDTRVSIALYNLGGQLIRTLFDGHQMAGRYQLLWDGKTTDGRRVSSGVYLVRMTSGDFIATRKILMTK